MKRGITRLLEFNIPIERYRHEVTELIKVFLGEEAFDVQLKFTDSCKTVDKNYVKREIYNQLVDITGYRPPWGILTGIRPVKIVKEMDEHAVSYDEIVNILRSEYLLRDDKLKLLMETYSNQRKLGIKKNNNLVGVYIGIPFCPTRCEYCSFTSNTVNNDEIERYLSALFSEICTISKRMHQCERYPETIYVGGGTPTTLNDDQLERLLSVIKENFDFKHVREFTVEAGRPDTITATKLSVMKAYGVNRMSINPQSMHKKTLEAIGRLHSPEDIIRAFRLAKEAGIEAVNADIIAGLPGETYEAFKETLEAVILLKPENITVHTLAIKRASLLKEKETKGEYAYHRNDSHVENMITFSNQRLSKEGYFPYYLYRQKHMTGNSENVGYCKEGTEGIYNIQIMNEHQTIIAFGAGGIGKAYFPEENRLERVPNVSNYKIYIERIDEMIERKEKMIFGGTQC